MKQFRYIVIAAILCIGSFSVVLQSSCSKNKCGSTTCANGGSCVDSKCICPTGYSGNSCQTGWSDPAIGTYSCKRSSCSPRVADTSMWQSAITKNATNGGYSIYISNFDKSNITVIATIDSAINGKNKITVSPATGTTGIQASGYYSNGVISLNFTSATGGVGGYTCDMVMTKL